jgi:hypothetical protein
VEHRVGHPARLADYPLSAPRHEWFSSPGASFHTLDHAAQRGKDEIMALRIFGDDASGFALHDEHDTPIGWIRGRTLGFRLFNTLDDAMQGARVAYEAAASWAARMGVSRPLAAIGDADLTLVHDGAYEWVASGLTPVARLLRPRADVILDDGQYGIELVIPQGIGAVAAIGGAQVIHSALMRRLPGVVVQGAQESDDGTYSNDKTASLAEA